MTCCNTTIQTFAGVASTTVEYIGVRPTVEVLYLIDGTWQTAASVITVTDTQVIVDHGGQATGVIKLLQ